MTSYQDLKDFFSQQSFKTIIAADAETRVSKRKNGDITVKIPAGGPAIALDPIAKASNAVFVARGKPEEEEIFRRRTAKLPVENTVGNYTLKKLFLTKEELDDYYYGFSNQVLWPLCHVAFERPVFEGDWYEGFTRINRRFAQAIKEEIEGETFIWVNDFQLSLVPKFLGRRKNTILAMFWHIPWPTWEVFRILPQKKEILRSLLTCDFLAFHRGYQARNFLRTVGREFEARIDLETSKIYYDGSVTTVGFLPMGVDTDVIRNMAPGGEELPAHISTLFENYKVMLGVDRLDYTKGLLLRFSGIARFLEKYPSYQGKVVYLGVLAPSREPVPSYQKLKKDVKALAASINSRFGRGGWQPIHLVNEVMDRADVIKLYQKSAVCLVTPRDDGMNLVSKEFIVASSMADDPGMLVLSKFAGSATDLTSALIVNPYDTEELAAGIHDGLTMTRDEKLLRIKRMTAVLEERNVYNWAKEFVEAAIASKT